MMRVLLVASVLGVALAGCGNGSVLTADRELSAITTRELAIRVRVTNVVGDWAGIAAMVDVTAPGAAWAVFGTERTDLISAPFGPAQRTIDGRVQLEIGRDWFRPGLCVDQVCEIDFVVSLDAEPTTPWSVVVSVVVDGAMAEGAMVEIVSRP